MPSIGIDVGSDSVRVYYEGAGDRAVCTREQTLEREDSGEALTMSALHLWRAVAQMVEEVDEGRDTDTDKNLQGSDPQSIASLLSSRAPSPSPGTLCVAATCSMVVMRRTYRNGRAVLCLADPGREVIVWMDRRAHQEAEWLNRRLAPDVLAQVGGAITAEMGIAKMKWARRQFGGLLVVFELYDWVSYVMMAGANVRAVGRGVEMDELERAVVTFPAGARAMDGSVKGWGADIMGEIGVEVACAPREIVADRVADRVAEGGEGNGLYGCEHFGTVLGPAARAGYNVVRGCIDCYAGPAAPWVTNSTSTYTVASSPSLSMVAGTLTCFIAAVPGASDPIPGIWGPFPNLVPVPVYSFGQAATGKLVRAAVADGDFARVEAHAARIEKTAGALLVRLARHHLYYGDRFGNRSPYGDFSMDEAVVRGDNASSADSVCCVAMADPDWPQVLRYYLVLEFLAFQTAQLTRVLAPAAVNISGSQARNARLVQMIALFAVAPAAVYVEADDAKWAGARACAQLGRVPLRHRLDPLLPESDVALLRDKYVFWLELAEWQSRWRRHNAGL